MGIFDFFHDKPGNRVVVFAGDRIEAGLIIGMLEEEGLHPEEWADMSGPFAGPVGMARVVVPPEEGEAAKRFLASLEEYEEGSEDEAEAPDEE